MNKKYLSYVVAHLFLITVCHPSHHNQTRITIEEPTKETCLIGEKNHEEMRDLNLTVLLGVAILKLVGSQCNIEKLPLSMKQTVSQKGGAILPRIGVLLFANAWMHNKQAADFKKIYVMEEYSENKKADLAKNEDLPNEKPHIVEQQQNLASLDRTIMYQKYDMRKSYGNQFFSLTVPSQSCHNDQTVFKEAVSKKTLFKTFIFAPAKLFSAIAELLLFGE